MSTEPSKSPDQWADVYRDGMPTYEAFAHRIERLIEELLKEKGPDYVQVEARAKSVDSFVAKLARRPGKYLDPLKDMHDLAGVRIICYYLSDVARVGSLIEDEFTVDSENSRSREERSDPDRFGYESDHYVVSCSSDREALPEWNSYRGMRAEIQVRTVLQHAWAAIDHKLAYKRGSEVPNELRRQLSRVSALLEVGDEQFEAARSASERLDASYDARARAGELDIPIDVASLHAYLTDNDVVLGLADIGRSVGFNIESPSATDGIGILVQASQAAAFGDVASLDSFLRTAHQWAGGALQIVWEKRPSGTGWSMPMGFLLATLVWIGTDIGLDSVQMTTQADNFFIEALKAARAAVVHSG
jgi:putative GTP pyrophosphokinase